MLLSDLLGREVCCGGERVGVVVDARFVLHGRVEGALADAELVGLVVGPRRTSFLGYERADQNAPALLNRLFAWRQRGSFLVDWDDVASVDDDGVVELRDGFTRWSSRLP